MNCDKIIILMKKYREPISYLFFGVLTTIINWVVSFVLMVEFDFDTQTYTTIAWIVSVLFAYIVNKIFVFRTKQSSVLGLLYEMLTFFGARVLSYCLDMGIMTLGMDILFMDLTVTKIISNVFVVIINYFAGKFISFRKNKK